MTDWDLLHRLRDAPQLFEAIRAGAGRELQLQKELRRESPDEVVRAALTLAELRRKAEAKFTRAPEMWFDRKGLEQATSEPVARHKARRFAGRVWDYCCGNGGSTIGLAERGEVVAVDLDPANGLRTQWNAEVYGCGDAVQAIAGDVERLTARDGLVHIDPDRRAGARGRSIRIEDSVPGLEFLRTLTREFAGGAIKLSPAGNFLGKFAGTEIELVSLQGEATEAIVWFGSLGNSDQFRATVLPAGESLTGRPLEAMPEFGGVERYVYDPDPAVVRAGLVDHLAEQLDLRRLDEAEEYLTSDRRVESPFVRAFEVDADLPNNDREIRAHFRAADIGQVEIKCRHIPVQVEAVRRKLPLGGSQAGVLLFARVGGKARAIVARRAD